MLSRFLACAETALGVVSNIDDYEVLYSVLILLLFVLDNNLAIRLLLNGLYSSLEHNHKINFFIFEIAFVC